MAVACSLVEDIIATTWVFTGILVVCITIPFPFIATIVPFITEQATATIGIGDAFGFAAIAFFLFIAKDVTQFSGWAVGSGATMLLYAKMISAIHATSVAVIVRVALPGHARARQLVIVIAAKLTRFTVGVGTARGNYLAALAINTFIATAAIFRGFA